RHAFHCVQNRASLCHPLALEESTVLAEIQSKTSRVGPPNASRLPLGPCRNACILRLGTAIIGNPSSDRHSHPAEAASRPFRPLTMLLYTHPSCLQHDPGPGHPECPARLAAVLQALHEALPGVPWHE